MKVSAIKQNPNNPRQIRGERLELLKRSITDFERMMTLRPIIVDEKNIVLGGNMRLAAIRALGMKEIPDEWVKRADDLTEEQKREFVIKDNAGFGEWDWDALANSWDDLPLADWGVDLPNFEAVESEIVEEDEAQVAETISKAKELQEKWGTASGQLWKLGEHRLLCGDSTKREDVERVMDGERAELCLTDPPYGIGEDYETHEDTAQNLAVLIAGFLPIARDISDRVLLTPGNSNQWLYPKPSWTLCWFVAAGTGMNCWGFTCWQPVLAYGKDPFLAAGKGSRPDALNMTESADNSLGHPCSKPIKVWSWFLERGSINEGDKVYEPFCGSGTTLIACEQLGRKARCIEIAPEYVAVTLQRFQDLTGKTPELIDG